MLDLTSGFSGKYTVPCVTFAEYRLLAMDPCGIKVLSLLCSKTTMFLMKVSSYPKMIRQSWMKEASIIEMTGGYTQRIVESEFTIAEVSQ